MVGQVGNPMPLTLVSTPALPRTVAHALCVPRRDSPETLTGRRRTRRLRQPLAHTLLRTFKRLDSARFRCVNIRLSNGVRSAPLPAANRHQCQGSEENRSHALLRAESINVKSALACRIQFHSAKPVKWSPFLPPETFPSGTVPRSSRRLCAPETPGVAKSGDAARRSACATSATGLCEVILCVIP